MFWLIFYVRLFCFFKQKTADEMRISDWSSDVCSSDLQPSKAVPLSLRPIELKMRVEQEHRAPDGRIQPDLFSRRLLDKPQAHKWVFRRLRPQKMRRSEERRVGTACVSTCRSRCSPNDLKKTTKKIIVREIKK